MSDTEQSTLLGRTYVAGFGTRYVVEAHKDNLWWSED